MNFNEATTEIESTKFAVRIGLANSFRAFLRNINGDQAVNDLLALASSRDVSVKILERILSVVKLRVDFRYLHPLDVALATYLWVLSRSSPELARSAAEASISLARTWWTEQVCSYILGEWSQRPSTVTSAGAIHFSGNFAKVTTSNVAARTSTSFSESLVGFEPAKEPLEISSKTAETSSFQHADWSTDQFAPLYTMQNDPGEQDDPE